MQRRSDNTTTSVFVVDDHTLVRQCLVRVIDFEDDLTVVGHGEGSAETVTEIRQLRPQVLVCDLEMPTIRGAQLISMASEAVPGLRILACSMHAAFGYIAEALHHGAHGYVLKSSPSERLIEGIRAVADGKGFIDPSLQGEVVRLVQQRNGPTAEAELTAQEIEVLRFVADGFTNPQIATRIGQSVETVKLRLRWCFRKLGANERASAVATAMRRGLL